MADRESEPPSTEIHQYAAIFDDIMQKLLSKGLISDIKVTSYSKNPEGIPLQYDPEIRAEIITALKREFSPEIESFCANFDLDMETFEQILLKAVEKNDISNEEQIALAAGGDECLEKLYTLVPNQQLIEGSDGGFSDIISNVWSSVLMFITSEVEFSNLPENLIALRIKIIQLRALLNQVGTLADEDSLKNFVGQVLSLREEINNIPQLSRRLGHDTRSLADPVTALNMLTELDAEIISNLESSNFERDLALGEIGLRAFLDVCESFLPNPTARNYSVEYVLEQIKGFLALIKTSSRECEYEIETVEGTQRALDDFGDIRVSTHMPTLTNTMLNVMKNARDRGDANRVTISLTIDKASHELKIKCLDNGKGFSQEALQVSAQGNQKLAFRPKFSTHTKGSGQGLANLDKIFSSLGNKIDIGNHKEGGYVIITLPIKSNRSLVREISEKIAAKVSS